MNMCKWGQETVLNVLVPACNSYTGEKRWAKKGVDLCIADIVKALNDAGIYTAGSCCGHGQYEGFIGLHDGRKLVIEYQTPEEATCGKEMSSTLRGHEIYKDSNNDYRFVDNHELTETTWFTRPCGHCGKYGNSNDGLPDPCLGQLPGVDNACCGHGNREESYIRFTNGVIIKGFIIDE